MKKLRKVTATLLLIGLLVGMLPTASVSALPPKENLDLARTAVGEGIVLLKNEGALPLKSNQTVALFGGGQVFTGSTENGYQIGGGGSGRVYYDDRTVLGPADALLEAAEAGKINVYKPLTEAYQADVTYVPDADMYTAAAAAADTAIMFVNRYSLEARDIVKTDWYLTDAEKSMMQTLSAKFDKLVVVLNTPSAMSTDWSVDGNADGIDVDGLLTIYMGGEQGANGLCDILLGDVNPSGKLADTYAADVEDYPSTTAFYESDTYTRYTEDIYVGYRYFETFAPEKVIYPFGHGLSYTDFSITTGKIGATATTITVPVLVKNTGSVAGKEVVQVYYSAPQAGEGSAKLSKAAKNLIAFEKTKLLAPGEQERLFLSFKIDDMASFDDTGVTGHKGSFVLEAGDYEIAVGNSVRSAISAGSFAQTALKVVSTPATTLTSNLDKRLTADGSYEVFYEFVSNVISEVSAAIPTVIEAESGARNGLKTENFKEGTGYFYDGTAWVAIPAGTSLGGHDGAVGRTSTFPLQVEQAGTYTVGFIMGNGDGANPGDLRDLLSISYSADGEHWTTASVNVDCKHTRNVGTGSYWWNFYYSQTDLDGNAYQVTLPQGIAYLRFTTLPGAVPDGAINMDKFVLIPEGATFGETDALVEYGLSADTTPNIAPDQLTWIEGESGARSGQVKTENFTASQGFFHDGTSWLSIPAGTVVGNFDKGIGDSVTYTVDVEKAGTYTLGFVKGNGGGLASGDLEDILSISVSTDGSSWTAAPNNLDCKHTREVGTGVKYWNMYYADKDLDGNPYTVTLPKGRVQIKLANLLPSTKGGCINLDKIVVIPQGLSCDTDTALGYYGILNLDEENFVGITYADVLSGAATEKEFLAQMSYNQLIDLTYGHATGVKYSTGTVGFSSNATAEKYGVISADTADGPAGIRSGLFTGTYWPCSTLQACTWNKELVEEIGIKAGGEAIGSQADIWLAPGVNIHRSPMCGRNFEYYSEDPVLTGRIGIALVKGVQSTGVGCEVKHFVANNKEDNRRYNDSMVSEKALREIYLKAFEMIIKEADPIAVMSSYNIVNGVQASTNAPLLQGVLREEWGFDGIITTDWDTSVRVTHSEEIIGGNTVKMPMASADVAEMQTAVRNGTLTREVLEQSAHYLISTLARCYDYTAKQYEKTLVANSGTTVIPATSYFRRSHQNTFSYIAPGVYAAENLTLTDADGTYGYFDVRVVIPVTGKYTLSCSYARNGGGWDNAYKIYVDGGATATYSPSVIQTASWKDFRTDEVATLELTKGEHTFRVQNGSGGLNILDIQLTACEHVAGPLVVDTPATQTTAGKGHKECSVCGYYAEDDIVIPATCEASIGGTNYTTLAQALAAAKSGEVVKLIQDVATTGVVVTAGITLDLAGHTLTTDYLVGLNTSAVINSAGNGAGKVVVDQENMTLSEDNSYLPVYDEEKGCYLFTRVKNDRHSLSVSGGKPTYSTSPMFKDYVHPLLDTKAEAAASGVEVIIRLTWCDATGQYLGSQDYCYFDNSVAQVIASYVNEGGTVNYGQQFYGIFVGSEIADGLDVQVSTVLRSAGVEMVSTPTALFA